jgi:chemotaxis protein methyltransferase CheR
MTSDAASAQIDAIELDLLLEGMHRAYGVDMRAVPRERVERAVSGILRESGMSTVSSLLDRVLHDRDYALRAVDALRCSDLALFSDVAFYRAMREQVVPWLRTFPYSAVWVVQAGAGSDVDSLAIVLEEAGLAERTRIYATQDDRDAPGRAATAGMSPACLRASERNYRLSGGTGELAAWFDQPAARCDGSSARSDECLIRGPVAARLMRYVVWAEYSLADGQTFNEFNLILCRNVLSAMTPAAQRRAWRVLTESLCVSGLLALGPLERPDTLPQRNWFKPWANGAGLHQRVR